MRKLLLAALLLCVAIGAYAEADDGIFVAPVGELPEGFLLGADVSSALSLENSGVVFKNELGEAQDLFITLAEHGMNCVRLRVWNDPFDSQGMTYGGGGNDLATAITLGRRATDAGLGVIIDFHYSDFWADPGKQFAPKAWEGMSADEKQQVIYDYTFDSLTELRNAGVNVVMVQIGNETNGKMSGETVFSKVAKLMKQAAKAVRDVDADIKIAVHFTNPETPDNYIKYAQTLWRSGVDYDVFASSWYPYWHGTLENLTNILTRVKDEFGKEVMIAEVSYAYTYLDGDSFGNTISEGATCDMPYTVSVQGQANCVRDAVKAVLDTDAGAGCIYWEAAWLPVPGADYNERFAKWQEYGSGWATSYASEYDPNDAGKWYGGCSCENQALFDFTGAPLPSLNVFRHLETGATTSVKVDGVDNPAVTSRIGDDITPPETVTAVFNDGSVRQIDVVWEYADYTKMAVSGVNKYVVGGSASFGGYAYPVKLTVNVVDKNYIDNPSFEDGDLSMWKIEDLTGKMSELFVIDKLSDAVSGSHSLHFYSPTQIEFTATQTLASVPAGTYNFYVTLHGGDVGEHEMFIFIESDGERRVCATTMTGWQQYNTPRIDGVQIGGGEAVIGIYIKCSSGGWGNIDDFVLAPVE